MRGTVKEAWTNAPWTIKAFGAATVVGVLWSLFMNDFGAFTFLLTTLLGALFFYWLLLGSRAIWILQLILEAASVVSLMWLAISAVWVDDRALTLAINAPLRVIEIFLLLHPLTRAWVHPRSQPAEPQLLP